MQNFNEKGHQKYGEIKLSIPEGKVTLAYCACPAGQSGYCNHIIALLYEIAEYSLKELSLYLKKRHVPVWHKDGEC